MLWCKWSTRRRRSRSGRASVAFEEHESGPELLVYIAAGVSLATSVINLIATIIKARSEGIRKGDHPAHPLELIVRRVHSGNEFREETVLRIGHTDSPDEAKLEQQLNDALFGCEFSLRRRRKGWCLRSSCPSRCASAPISFSHFFDGEKQTERRGSRVKGARFWRVHRSVAQTLDSATAIQLYPSRTLCAPDESPASSLFVRYFSGGIANHRYFRAHVHVGGQL